MVIVYIYLVFLFLVAYEIDLVNILNINLMYCNFLLNIHSKYLIHLLIVDYMYYHLLLYVSFLTFIFFDIICLIICNIAIEFNVGSHPVIIKLLIFVI